MQCSIGKWATKFHMTTGTSSMDTSTSYKGCLRHICQCCSHEKNLVTDKENKPNTTQNKSYHR